MRYKNEWTREIKNTLQCSTDPTIHVEFTETFSKNLPPRNGKYLLENGTLMETRNLQIECQADEGKCSEIEKYEVISILCKDQQYPRLEIVHSDSTPVPVSSLVFANGVSSDYCCTNTSHVLQFYGENCDSPHIMQNYSFDCRFSEFFKEGPCQFGIQRFSQFCMMDGCVVKQFYRAMSCQDLFPAVESCPVHQYPC